MNRSRFDSPSNDTFVPILATAAGLLLIWFSTVFRGSNRWVPLIMAEWLGLLLLVIVCAGLLGQRLSVHASEGGWPRWATAALVASPLWVGVLQMALLPAADHHAIWSSALAGVPVAALFLLALSCREASLTTLLRAWVAVAVAQAVIGIAQLSELEALQFGAAPLPYSTGTFSNRNHFANFMVMTIPLVILELAPQARHGSHSRRSWVWLCSLFLLVTAILGSESRTGLVTALLAGSLSALVVFASSNRKSMMSRFAVWLVPAFIMIALVAGGMDWLYRFEWDALSASAYERSENRDATWQGALAHLPWGSGLGTFANAFAAHQPDGNRFLMDYAHSDFLQLFFEAGVFAWVLATLTLVLCSSRLIGIVQLMRSPGTDLTRSTRLSLVALCGVLAQMIHSWVDFPTHIPANAMLGAFLLGVFLREFTPRLPAQAGKQN